MNYFDFTILMTLIVFFSILLGLADGEVLPDPDVQKAALNVIINSVCGPMSRVNYDKLIIYCLIFTILWPFFPFVCMIN